jgi:hypothetical protein
VRNLPLARSILQDSERTSWRHIWKEEMQARFAARMESARFGHVAKPEKITTPPAEPSEIMPETLVSGDSDSPKISKSEVNIDDKPRRAVRCDSLMFGLPRAEEVAAIYDVEGQTKWAREVNNPKDYFELVADNDKLFR